VTPCSVVDLRNVGVIPQHYTASQPRWPRLHRHESVKTRNFLVV